MNQISEKDLKEIVKSSQGSGKSFAEFLAEVLKDKLVEIYLGDAYEEVSVDQISTSYPAVFCGKIISAYKECLVLDCLHVSSDKKVQSGRILFINERSIKALTEINGMSTLQDIYWKSLESLRVLALSEK